jgi:hypothetical protein
VSDLQDERLIEDVEGGGVTDSRPWWRRWLPEPFWSTLLSLLTLALLGAIPFWIVGALIWPNATRSAPIIFTVGYVLGIPFTWWMLRERKQR